MTMNVYSYICLCTLQITPYMQAKLRNRFCIEIQMTAPNDDALLDVIIYIFLSIHCDYYCYFLSPYKI